MAIRDLFFNFLGDSRSLDRASDAAASALGKVESKADKVARKFDSIGKGIAKATLPIAGALGLGLKSLAENEKLLAQTDAVIASMGGAANVTSGDVFALANEISNLSGVSHESIVEGQNLLLTFGNIKNEAGEGNDIYDQTVRLMTDMSVAMGSDAKTGAIQLGKALNDPVKGVSALADVGVSFTEKQREMIAAMVEAGDIAGAQRIILGELENQFGGSAEAAGNTMTGSINKLKNSFEELARNLARVLVPFLEKLTKVLQSVLSWFNDLSPGVQHIIGIIATLAVTLGPLLIGLGKLVGAFTQVTQAFGVLKAAFAANPWLLLAAAVIAIVALIIANWDKIKAFLLGVWEKIKSAAAAVGSFLKDAFSGAINFVKNLFLNFTGPGLLIKHWDKIREGIADVVGFFEDAWNGVVEFFKGIPGKIADAARGMWDGIRDAFKGAVNSIIDAWNRLELKIGGQRVNLPFGLGFTIPTITLSTPNVPRLHAGQLFRSPVGGPGEGLALLRDGERVLPPQDSAGGTRGGREPLIVQLVVDARTLAEVLVDHEEAIA